MASLFRLLFYNYSVYTARLLCFRLHVRHLDFRQNDTMDFVGDGTIEKPTPENIGVDTKIMFLSCRIAEIEGVQVCTPWLFVLQIRSGSPRVNRMADPNIKM